MLVDRLLLLPPSLQSASTPDDPGTRGFVVTNVPVHPELRRAIEAVWVVEGSAVDDREASFDVLPSTAATMCVTYGPRVTLAGAPAPSSFSGIFGRPRSYVAQPAIGVVMVRFRPGGLRSFLPMAVDDLEDRSVAAEVFFRRELVELEDRLRADPTPAQRGARVQAFLQSKLLSGGWDPLAVRIAQAIVSARGQISLDSLAKMAAISERQLERRFARAVGVAPKRFARIVRFGRALDLGRLGMSWAGVALDAGYTDQSHLARDFRALTGTPPDRLTKSSFVPSLAST